MQNKSWEHTRIYKTEHNLEVKERSQTKQSRVSFDMGINCNTKDESIRKVFTRENYLINSKIPKEHHIRLLYELEQAVYPLEIEVNTYENFERIPGHGLWFSTWQKKADAILQEKYSREFAESLKNQVQGNLETEEKLKQKIQEKAFWKLYFFGMQNAQNDNTLRWNILKVGTLYFTGHVQTKIEENKWVSVYRENQVKPEESLAQKLADHLNAIVYAFLRRSNYTSTWLDGGDQSYTKNYITIEDEDISNPLNPMDWYRKLNRKGWDQALWNTSGAYMAPTSGKTPGGLLEEGMFIFEKGKKARKK